MSGRGPGAVPALSDLDGGKVVGRPEYDEEVHRYGDVRRIADDPADGA